MYMTRLTLVVSILLLAIPAYAAGVGKDTVAKERKAGTTTNVGNRCPGGTFDSCVQANIRVGWKPSTAASHCTRTCTK
jgi:hypothetical protein